MGDEWSVRHWLVFYSRSFFFLGLLILSISLACILGSGIICVDLILRTITRRKSFQIVNSNGFLSASLCLSSGVMVRNILSELHLG